MPEQSRGRMSGREGHGTHEPRLFLWTAAIVLAIYLGLRYAAPWLVFWLGASQSPAPVPAFARAMYMICAVIGALVYVSSEEERWRLFLGPVVRLFVLRPGETRRTQLVVLGLMPILVGWVAWQRVMPRTGTPAVLRIQHPTMPGQYEDLVNPFRELTGGEREAIEREGTVLYQKNCRPCHGTKARGDGPLARGLRLRPIDFSDPGTIATVVETYPFWRIKKGALGLPYVATPWNSAMPAWESELGDDEIWRIIMAEYRISGTEARRPEKLER